MQRKYLIIDVDANDTLNEIDVTSDNILPTGTRRGWVPRKRDPVEGYHLINDTDKPSTTIHYLNAMEVYADSI